MKFIVVYLSLSLACFGQGVRVPSLTRTVQLFGDLERKLASADSAAKLHFLADDFEERLCAEPGTPVPRSEWLQKISPSEVSFSQEAVHAFGEINVYSALQTTPQSREMIVDTWKQADGGWKLAVRYRCPATGAKPAESGPPKRY
jgi:hypothetical protein